jgi:hypothetical protein
MVSKRSSLVKMMDEITQEDTESEKLERNTNVGEEPKVMENGSR